MISVVTNVIILLSITCLIKAADEYTVIREKCRRYDMDGSGPSNETVSAACVMGPIFVDCDSIPGNGNQVLFSCEELGTNFLCYGTGKNLDDLCGPPPPKCTTTGIFPIGNVKRCQNFYTCINDGVDFIQTIERCKEGYEFSPIEKKCMEINEAGCSKISSKINCSGLGMFGRVADPFDCSSYYQCINFGFLSTTIKKKCPMNLHFDDRLTFCSPYATCGIRPF